MNQDQNTTIEHNSLIYIRRPGCPGLGQRFRIWCKKKGKEKKKSKVLIFITSVQQHSVALQSFSLTINAYADISQPFSHTCKPKHTRKKKKLMSHCVLVISLYMYMTYMHVLFFLVHIVLADQHLFFKRKKKKKVEGHLRGPASHLSLAEHKPTTSRQVTLKFF